MKFQIFSLWWNPCVSVWIFMPNWCGRIILPRDRAPGLWHDSLGASQSRVFPSPKLMLCYSVESRCCTRISLKFIACGSWEGIFCFLWTGEFTSDIVNCFSPSETLWSDCGCDREQTVFLGNTSCPVAISQFCVALSSGVLWLRLFRMMFGGFPSYLVCCVSRDCINQWPWKMCKLKL